VKRRLASLLCCVLALASCGGDDTETPRGDDPFPLAVGNRWDTEVTRSVSAGPVIPVAASREVTRLFLLDGVPTWELEQGLNIARSDEWLQRSDTAIVRVPTPQDGVVDQAVGPRVVLLLPVQVGQQWVQVDRVVTTGDYLGPDGVPYPTTVRATAEVQAQEAITVPAGTFLDAYRVRYHERQETVRSPEDVRWSDHVRIDWLVPGVGIVARYDEDLNDSSLRTKARSEVLLSYRLAPAAP
jgi:hypothetical protein